MKQSKNNVEGFPGSDDKGLLFPISLHVFAIVPLVLRVAIIATLILRCYGIISEISNFTPGGLGCRAFRRSMPGYWAPVRAEPMQLEN